MRVIAEMLGAMVRDCVVQSALRPDKLAFYEIGLSRLFNACGIASSDAARAVGKTGDELKQIHHDQYGLAVASFILSIDIFFCDSIYMERFYRKI